MKIVNGKNVVPLYGPQLKNPWGRKQNRFNNENQYQQPIYDHTKIITPRKTTLTSYGRTRGDLSSSQSRNLQNSLKKKWGAKNDIFSSSSLRGYANNADTRPQSKTTLEKSDSSKERQNGKSYGFGQQAKKQNPKTNLMDKKRILSQIPKGKQSGKEEKVDYKAKYLQALEKIKQLEKELEEVKRNAVKKTNSDQQKPEDSPVEKPTIGHLFSYQEYDKKNLVNSKLITEEDNEQSSLFENRSSQKGDSNLKTTGDNFDDYQGNTSHVSSDSDLNYEQSFSKLSLQSR